MARSARAGRAGGEGRAEEGCEQERDQEAARRARAREVGLFRYGLIQDALDEALKYLSTRPFERPSAFENLRAGIGHVRGDAHF